jgi:pimeloyl-ACP methyl ester carboxylesterase
LADAETRTAFLHTLRAVVDIAGQRVSAADRLYLAAEAPTLIVWGDRDSIIPVAQGRATHAAIPGSRLEIFEGTGHFPHCERPDRFVDVLVDFMATTSPSTTSASEWRARMLNHTP